VLFLLGYRQIKHARPGTLAGLGRLLFPISVALVVAFTAMMLFVLLVDTTESARGSYYTDGSTPMLVVAIHRHPTCRFGGDQRFVAAGNGSRIVDTRGYYLPADGRPKGITCDGPAKFVESRLVAPLRLVGGDALVVPLMLLFAVSRVLGWSWRIVPRHVGRSAANDEAHRLSA
jgi:hypothetical protein